MKLLTFLGLGDYRETNYTWQGQKVCARYAPLATCQFLDVDELIVFLTPKVEIEVFPDLKQACPQDIRLNPVSIPVGNDESELWNIFDKIAQHVEHGETVAFDITHGLRIFPLLGLLAAGFLRTGLNVNISALLYGAFDIGQNNNDGTTPMFDLSSMLSLLEWSSAADRFNRTGDSRFLASLVKEQKNNLARATQKDDYERFNELAQLNNLADALTSITQSVNLIRPMDTLEYSSKLSQYIEKARPVLEETATTRPFMMLLDNIESTYSPLGLANPLSRDTLNLSLDKQRYLIQWYVDREHWAQAVTLSREWLVNWIMVALGETALVNRADRDRVEKVINIEAHNMRDRKQKKDTFEPLFLKNIPAVDSVLELWNALTDARNDLDHAGMREDPRPAKALIEQAKGVANAIQSLRLPGEA